jgi:hypothetical protein
VPDLEKSGLEEGVGAILDPAGRIGVGGAAVRRVVLDAAVLGRVVRRGDDDAVGEPAGAPLVPRQDGVRDDRGRRVAVVLGVTRLDVVGRQHLEGGALRRVGERMAVLAEEERAVDALLLAVLADGVDDGQDVRLVEAPARRRPAVPRGAEGDALQWIRRVGHVLVVRGAQRLDIDELRLVGGLPSSWMHVHGPKSRPA